MTFGLDRLITETTFVKDDLLKRQCRQFDVDLENDRVFQMDFARLEDGIEATLDITRGPIPLGSDIFQAVMNGLIKEAEILKAAQRRLAVELESDQISDEDESACDVSNTNKTEESGVTRTERQKKQMKKSASFYPIDKENVLLKRYRSEQLFRNLPNVATD